MNMNSTKTGLLIVLLMGSGYYGYTKYQSVTPSAAINNGMTGEGGPRRDRAQATPQESEERRNRMAQTLNLTPAQQAEMDKLRANGVEGRERWQQMQQILTPEQRQRMDAARTERRDRGARASLSQADFARYKQRSEQQRANRPPRGNRGNRGGQS